MKVTTIIAVFYCFSAFLFSQSGFAYTMNGIKVFNGDHGSVATIHKHVEGKRSEYQRSHGKLTVSDVGIELTISGQDLTIKTLVSGQVQFKSEHVFHESASYELNGVFHSLVPQHHTLKLVEIFAETNGEELVLSGYVVTNDRKVEINEAPENIKQFVRRLIWWISHQ